MAFQITSDFIIEQSTLPFGGQHNFQLFDPRSESLTLTRAAWKEETLFCIVPIVECTSCPKGVS